MSLILAAQVAWEANRVNTSEPCTGCGAEKGELCRHTFHTAEQPNHKLVPCKERG